MSKSFIANGLESLKVDISTLKYDPMNAKKHPTRSIEELARSLEAFGQRKPIIARSGSRIVIAGNGLLMAARKLGWDSIAVLFVEESDEAAAAFAIADNSTPLLSSWDEEALAGIMSSLGDQPLIGFSDDEVNRLAALLEKPLGEPPQAPPASERGQGKAPAEEPGEKTPKPPRSQEPSQPTIKPFTLMLPFESYDEFISNAEKLKEKLGVGDIATALVIGLHKLTS